MKEPEVSAVLEDYLEAIFNLCRSDRGARSRDIAEALSVHKSSVTSALRTLRQNGLVHYEPYEAVTLTRRGRQVAEEVVRRHDILKRFLIDVLGVDGEEAEKAACGMEHSVSRDIVDKLVQFAKNLQHGGLGENSRKGAAKDTIDSAVMETR